MPVDWDSIRIALLVLAFNLGFYPTGIELYQNSLYITSEAVNIHHSATRSIGQPLRHIYIDGEHDSNTYCQAEDRL